VPGLANAFAAGARRQRDGAVERSRREDETGAKLASARILSKSDSPNAKSITTTEWGTMHNRTKRPMRTHRHGLTAAVFSAGNGSERKASRPEGVRLADANSNYKRYLARARAAASAGDAIESENLYQHAEHYYRLMRE